MIIEVIITEKVFHTATIETDHFTGDMDQKFKPFRIAELINEIKDNPNAFIKQNKEDFIKESEFVNVVLTPE